MGDLTRKQPSFLYSFTPSKHKVFIDARLYLVYTKSYEGAKATSEVIE